ANVLNKTVGGKAYDQIITGAGAGGGPNVSVFDPQSNYAAVSSFFVYDPRFTGGVRVAGYDPFTSATTSSPGRVVTTAGPGGGADVGTFDALTGQRVDNFFAYDPRFSGGLWVAAGRHG